MEIVVSWIPIFVGWLFVVGAFLHEKSWWLRSSWSKYRGTVVGNEQSKFGDFTYAPKILVKHPKKGEVTFLSSYYSQKKIKIGSGVEVLISPDGEKMEILTSSTRYFFTFILLVFGFAFILLGSQS